MIKVIKIGGNVVDNEQMLQNFLRDFAALDGPRILVHGGGVMASRMQEALGQQPVMIEGRRVTDEQTLRVVTMVYSGWCNKHITALLQSYSCNAIGLSGCDGNVITASRRAPRMVNGELVDYGFIGDVKAEGVNAGFLSTLVNGGISPVLCAINHDGKGDLLNTNADTIAQSVAVSLAQAGEEVQLIYCFEKPGVLLDKDDDSTLIKNMDKELFVELRNKGKVADGMIPKLENSFQAIDFGVKSVVICHAANILEGKGTILR